MPLPESVAALLKSVCLQNLHVDSIDQSVLWKIPSAFLFVFRIFLANPTSHLTLATWFSFPHCTSLLLLSIAVQDPSSSFLGLESAHDISPLLSISSYLDSA